MHECRVHRHTHTHAHTHTHQKVSHTNTQDCPCIQHRRGTPLSAGGYLSFLMDETWLEARSVTKESVLVCMWVEAKIHGTDVI